MVKQCIYCDEWYCPTCDLLESCEGCGTEMHCHTEDLEYNDLVFCSQDCLKEYKESEELE